MTRRRIMHYGEYGTGYTTLCGASLERTKWTTVLSDVQCSKCWVLAGGLKARSEQAPT